MLENASKFFPDVINLQFLKAKIIFSKDIIL